MNEIVRQPVYADYPVIGSDARDALRLGRFADRQMDLITGRIAYGGERNSLIFGPNGSGKGVRLLVPNLLQTYGQSIFVVDPKGELAAITAPFRRLVSNVVIINPFEMFADRPGYGDLRSNGFNPLAELNPHAPSFNRDAGQLAEALIEVNPKDPHWDVSARALVAAVIMYVVLEAHDMLSPEVMETAGPEARPEGPKPTIPTMARVRDLVSLPSERANAGNNHMGFGIPRLALAMMQAGHRGLRNKAAQFAHWSDEKDSIQSAAQRQTESFDDDEIAGDMAKTGLRMGSMKERPTTVYLVLHPDHMERHAKWLRLTITAALQAVMRPREYGEPKVMFMLDEFAALGHMEIIETVWALVRGYGIQILPIFQDLGQLKIIYKERWETFIAQAGAVTSFAPNDLTTARWISERASDTTQIVTSGSYSESSTRSGGNSPGGANSGWSNNSSYSSSSQPTRVPFVQLHSLFGMHKGATVSFIEGLSDIVPGYAPPYWDIAQCVERARANPYRAKMPRNLELPNSERRYDYMSQKPEQHTPLRQSRSC